MSLELSLMADLMKSWASRKRCKLLTLKHHKRDLLPGNGPIANKHVSGTVGIPIPTTAPQDNFQNLGMAIPSIFASVPSPGRKDCGPCTLVYPGVCEPLLRCKVLTLRPQTIDLYCERQNHTNARRLLKDSPTAFISSKSSKM